MRFYFYKTPDWFKYLYPKLNWKIDTNNKDVYLTFDDGPMPGATDYVLNQLEKYDAKGTFFMVGENVKKNPHVFKDVVNAGHSIGNHTYNHLSGWKYNQSEYLENVYKCDKIIEDTAGLKPAFFRPPYGRINRKQVKSIYPTHSIVMWSILSGDFDKSLNFHSSRKALSKSRNGDILVFHDSNKYLDNIKKLLPDVLQILSDKGYNMKGLKD